MLYQGFCHYNYKVRKKIMGDKTLGFAWELAKTVIGVLLFVAIFRFFILQPFYVIGSSMEPTYHNGDYLFVNELTYLFSKPKRGDVIVFRHPEEECTAFIDKNPLLKRVFEGPCKSYIKRVIGLPGDTVEVKEGKVFVNGNELKEDYIQDNLRTLGNQIVKLGNDEYYVLGDNRLPNASSDSREWGPLTPKYIIGKSFVRLLPVDKIGLDQEPSY